MVQEFDYCELCGCRKSIYTDIHKGKDVCKKCKKEMDKLPEHIRKRDNEYRELLQEVITKGRGNKWI